MINNNFTFGGLPKPNSLTQELGNITEPLFSVQRSLECFLDTVRSPERSAVVAHGQWSKVVVQEAPSASLSIKLVLICKWFEKEVARAEAR